MQLSSLKLNFATLIHYNLECYNFNYDSCLKPPYRIVKLYQRFHLQVNQFMYTTEKSSKYPCKESSPVSSAPGQPPQTSYEPPHPVFNSMQAAVLRQGETRPGVRLSQV